MYACISYTLSACGLYVRIRHILYTKYYPYMYFPNICTTQPSKAYHILTPLVSPLPRFKEHHKAMTFQSGVTKRTWPVGSSAETRCGRIPTTWNLLSNVCGPKLWTTPPKKKKNSQFQLKTAEIIIPFRILTKIVGLINSPTCKIEYIRIDQGHHHLDRLIGISPNESSKWLSHQQPFSINTEFKGSWSLLFGDRWMGNVPSQKIKNRCVTLKRFRKQKKLPWN